MPHPLAPGRKSPAVSPPRVRKVAGSEPLRPAAAHTPSAPAATAPPAAVAAVPPPAVAGVPAAASAPAAESNQGTSAEQPERSSPEHWLGVQDGLASWVCDLSLLHELTERLARTAVLDDTLREVVQAGGTLVGARRGLITLSPADGLGPDTTIGLGLEHADLGALETVGFGGVPPGTEEVLHPDLHHAPGSRGRQLEVAAQLGLGAGYGLALAVDGTGSTPDPAKSSTTGAAPSPEPGGTDVLLGDSATADFRDFSTGGTDFSTTDGTCSAPPGKPAPIDQPAPFTEPAPIAEPFPAGRRRLGQVVWFYDEAAEPTARQRRLTGM
jgi:hypothetical protein